METVIFTIHYDGFGSFYALAFLGVCTDRFGSGYVGFSCSQACIEI